MKIVLGNKYASVILVNTKDELKLGPFDFVMVGDHQVAGYVNGEFSIISRPRIKVAILNQMRRKK